MTASSGGTATLSAADLAQLRQLIDTTDYSAIRSQPYTGVCPTAYDGQEVIYTFTTSGGRETLRSCEVAIDPAHPLFSFITSQTSRLSPND